MKKLRKIEPLTELTNFYSQFHIPYQNGMLVDFHQDKLRCKLQHIVIFFDSSNKIIQENKKTWLEKSLPAPFATAL